MTWYSSKWWRFATSSSRRGVMSDADGRWIHLIGSIWWRATGPEKIPKCVHNVVACTGGYEDGDHVVCLDCDTDLTTGKSIS